MSQNPVVKLARNTELAFTEVGRAFDRFEA